MSQKPRACCDGRGNLMAASSWAQCRQWASMQLLHVSHKSKEKPANAFCSLNSPPPPTARTWSQVSTQAPPYHTQ
ncbi:hypothetical protein HaLaN_22468 [Haematococcus lacustris]|uniref:Uncharacterized protein n=1 Tax=Haematococcus lacustris TaxID=44745 RepID=A0A699ZP79_HAELA|nr:hypothetical protein HaLaN_22468 [Haematococcus lacustris]